MRRDDPPKRMRQKLVLRQRVFAYHYGEGGGGSTNQKDLGEKNGCQLKWKRVQNEADHRLTQLSVALPQVSLTSTVWLLGHRGADPPLFCYSSVSGVIQKIKLQGWVQIDRAARSTALVTVTMGKSLLISLKATPISNRGHSPLENPAASYLMTRPESLTYETHDRKLTWKKRLALRCKGSFRYEIRLSH